MMRPFHKARFPVVLLGTAVLISTAQAEERSPPSCTAPPWASFAGKPANRPYRPLITFQADCRIGRKPPFSPARLNVDLSLEQPGATDITMIGDTPVIGVPSTRMLPGLNASGYYYEPNGALCKLTRSQIDSQEFRTAIGYSGARLQLSHDDLLALNFQSKLPFTTPMSADISQPDQAPFGGAPCQSSNVHTHGLLVSPYRTTKQQGDYVLNLSSPTPPDYPDACSSPPMPSHTHNIVDKLRYRILIPHKPKTPEAALKSRNHPSGLFWFHPHPHGYSASQLTGGTTGLITVGNLSDYASNLSERAESNIRFLMIKDAQVDPIAGSVNFRFRASSDPGLCPESPTSGHFWPNGFCEGDGGNRWIFTINGVQAPRIAQDVRQGENEIWRIANASPTVSYRLSIIPKAEVDNTPLNPDKSPRLSRKPFKVLAKDGAALPTGGGMSAEEKEILLMPGARIEIEIRDLGNQDWALVTEGLQTGGDRWPHIVLATLKGAEKAAAPMIASPEPYVTTTAGPTVLGASAAPKALKIEALSTRKACDRLNGAERVILFVKNTTFGPKDKKGDLFGVIAGLREPGKTDLKDAVFFKRASQSMPLVYMSQAPLSEIIDLLNQPYAPDKPGNFVPSFGNFPEFGNVCTRLSKNQPEEWIIENWTNEIHNFHIHQTRFFVEESNQTNLAYFSFPCRKSAYPDDEANAACRPSDSSSKEPVTGFGDQLIEQFYLGHTSMGRESGTLAKAAHDSVPIPRGTKDCNGDPTNLTCKPGRVTVRIPFDRNEQLGTFVYHCHILEHEDRGMMGLVQVIQ